MAFALHAEGTPETVSSNGIELKHAVAKVSLKTTNTIPANTTVSVAVPQAYTGYNVQTGAPAGETQEYKHETTVNATITGTTDGADVFSFYTLVTEGEQTVTIDNGISSKEVSATLAPNRHVILNGSAGIDGLVIDLSQQTSTYEITDDGIYYFIGSGSYGIKVSSGNPDIYLDDATISVGVGPAINITDGNPTIHVKGTNSVTAGSGAGIFVAQGSTVTITGDSRSDVLTATGGAGSAGIGSYSTSDGTNYSCGNITISNVTLTARSEGYVGAGDFAAGIGSAGVGTVGSISISDATIYAQGYGDNTNMGAAAIGGGVDGTSSDIQTAFDITISNSTIHATRGCPQASYIGAGGINGVKPAGYNIISTARITGSHVYDESGKEITQ